MLSKLKNKLNVSKLLKKFSTPEDYEGPVCTLQADGTWVCNAVDDILENELGDLCLEKAGSSESFVILELFTSNGCKNCRPAEKIFGKVREQAEASNQRIFALSFHVDSWDSDKWSDPLACKFFTERQMNYTLLLDSAMYLPQLILNGGYETPGSRSKDVSKLLRECLKETAESLNSLISLNVTVKADTENPTVQYRVRKATKPCKLNVALVEGRTEIDVTGGDNKGKKMVHHGVVRLFYTILLNDFKNKAGQAGEFQIKVPNQFRTKDSEIVAFTQLDNGKVTGSNILKLAKLLDTSRLSTMSSSSTSSRAV